MKEVTYKVCIGITAQDYNEVYILHDYFGAFTTPVDELGALARVNEVLTFTRQIENETENDLIMQGIKIALMYNDADCYDCEGRLYASERLLECMDLIRENIEQGLDRLHRTYYILKGE